MYSSQKTRSKKSGGLPSKTVDTLVIHNLWTNLWTHKTTQSSHPTSRAKRVKPYSHANTYIYPHVPRHRSGSCSPGPPTHNHNLSGPPSSKHSHYRPPTYPPPPRHTRKRYPAPWLSRYRALSPICSTILVYPYLWAR